MKSTAGGSYFNKHSLHNINSVPSLPRYPAAGATVLPRYETRRGLQYSSGRLGKYHPWVAAGFACGTPTFHCHNTIQYLAPGSVRGGITLTPIVLSSLAKTLAQSRCPFAIRGWVGVKFIRYCYVFSLLFSCTLGALSRLSCLAAAYTRGIVKVVLSVRQAQRDGAGSISLNLRAGSVPVLVALCRMK